MNPGVTLHPVSENDIREITSLYNYYIKNSTATFGIDVLSEEEMRSLLIFDKPLYRSFTIHSSGEIAGYGIISNFKKREGFDTTAEITIYLKPGLSGKGIGKPAITLLEDFARSVKLHALVALVCGENTPSIRLFENNGYARCAHYREIGKKFGRYLDLIVFEKIIS